MRLEDEFQLLLKQVQESDDIKAYYELGRCYELALGTPVNKEKSDYWYSRALTPQGFSYLQSSAENGDSQAQFIVGRIYDKGQGTIAQDRAKAVKWYRLAAERGYAWAQYNLGVMYDNGQGVAKDHAAAMKWNRFAAEQGLAQAQLALGATYQRGDVCRQNYARAVYWYQKAMAQGSTHAQRWLKEIKITPELEQQLQRIEQRAAVGGRAQAKRARLFGNPKKLLGHAQMVRSLAALPDGRVVSGLSDGKILIWDLHRGIPMRTILTCEKPVVALAVLPDGRVVSGGDKDLRVWNLQTGECEQTLKGHPVAVMAVVVLPDGRVVSGAGDGTLKLWDLQTGACVWTITGYTGLLCNLAVLPDGFGVSASQRGSLERWNIQAGQWAHPFVGHTGETHTLTGHTDAVTVVAVLPSPDGRVVSGSCDHTIKVWNTFSGRCEQTLVGHTDIVKALVGLPNGRHLASASRDKTVKIWDLWTGECIQTLTGFEHTVQALILVPASPSHGIYTSQLVSGGGAAGISEMYSLSATLVQEQDSQHVPLFNLEELQRQFATDQRDSFIVRECWLENNNVAPTYAVSQTLEGRTYGMSTLIALPDGRIINRSGDDGIQLLDLTTGSCHLTLNNTNHDIFYRLPSGQLVSTTERDKSISLWDLGTGARVGTLAGHIRRVTSLAVLPDGRLASGSQDETIKLWDLSDRRCVHTVKAHQGKYASGVSALVVLSDGRLVSGGYDGTISVWDPSSWLFRIFGRSERTWVAYGKKYSAVAVCNLIVLSGDRLASKSGKGKVKLWDPNTGDCIGTMKVPSIGKAFSLLPDGRLACGAKNSIILRDPATGISLATPMGHRGYIGALAVLPTGQLITGGEDGALRIWSAQPQKKLIGITEVLAVLSALQEEVQFLDLTMLDLSGVPLTDQLYQAVLKLLDKPNFNLRRVRFNRADLSSGQEEAILKRMELLEQRIVSARVQRQAAQLKAAQESDDPLLHYELGRLHESGLDRPVDEAQMRFWYDKALVHWKLIRSRAEAEVPQAQFIWGRILQKGQSELGEDNVQAVHWYRLAAEQGDMNAQRSLGWMCAKGHGITTDGIQAAHWYRKAAEQGDVGAQFDLGLMCAMGLWIAKDESQAFYWYYKAAKQGLRNAQYNLGLCFYQGKGVGQDYVQAAHWFRQSLSAQLNLAERGPRDSGAQEEVTRYPAPTTPHPLMGRIRGMDVATERRTQDRRHQQFNLAYRVGARIGGGRQATTEDEIRQEVDYWFQEAANQVHNTPGAMLPLYNSSVLAQGRQEATEAVSVSAPTPSSPSNSAQNRAVLGSATREPHEKSATRELHGRSATREPHERGATREPHERSATREPHGRSATREPHERSATRDSHERGAIRNPQYPAPKIKGEIRPLPRKTLIEMAQPADNALPLLPKVAPRVPAIIVPEASVSASTPSASTPVVPVQAPAARMRAATSVFNLADSVAAVTAAPVVPKVSPAIKSVTPLSGSAVPTDELGLVELFAEEASVPASTSPALAQAPVAPVGAATPAPAPASSSSSTSILSHALEISPSAIERGKEIGSGGFGKVYVGVWHHTQIAIKTLHIHRLSEKATQAFCEEAAMTYKLRHENIVTLYGICVAPEYQMVLEYCANGSLYALLKSQRPLDWKLRQKIALDIAKGLAFLHSNDIIHRDLKSLNVLLDRHMTAKIGDFGLSVAKKEALTSSTQSKGVAGSVLWMAPELFARGGKCTKASDIYSYAMVLWEIASRQSPFADEENIAMVPTWIQQGERESIPADTPSSYAAIIQRCWASEPQTRPAAAEIIPALGADISIDTDGEATTTLSSSSSNSYLSALDSCASAQSTSSSGYANTLDSTTRTESGVGSLSFSS